MSLVCNKVLALTPAQLRDKKQLAQDAGVELLGAVSDVFRALEMRHDGDSVANTGVYLSSAATRLHNAQDLLGDVGALLRSKALGQEAATWYQRLDYARLYHSGVAAGQLPASQELWSELVESVVAGGPVAVCDAYQSRIDRVAELLARWLRNADNSDDPTTDETLIAIQSEVLSLAVYAQCVAYLNKVEPLDTQWLPATAETIAATA